ncbi:hypothetical protein JOE21_002195 [Desmospora profundinema]|uniref:Uncharacterized protein n=1 Tax=Desmospora profundinema TaxID=1571184 RepID=A0ABU1IN33_9BACL|nr:hypothetical protein [Desmospora profundinema]
MRKSGHGVKSFPQERKSILLRQKGASIYGSHQREVVDGLFRPMYTCTCCLLRDSDDFRSSIECVRQTLIHMKASGLLLARNLRLFALA